METCLMIADGALASCAAAVVSNPFEVIKVRLQLQGELQHKGMYSAEYRGVFQGLVHIFKVEGMRGVQRGLLPSFAHQTILNGLRLGLFQPVRHEIHAITGHHGMHVDVVSGLLSGVVGAFVAAPVLLVKTRLQTQRDVSGERHYSGLLDGLTRVYRAGGMTALFRGAGTICPCYGLGSAIQLSVYEKSKIVFCSLCNRPGNDSVVHLLSSTVASFFVAMLMNPLDVVMTRRFNSDGVQYRRNIVSTFALIVRCEGVGGLGKGAFALWARLGPHTVVTFLCLEKIREFRRKHFGGRH